jgi:hypothetical protein
MNKVVNSDAIVKNSYELNDINFYERDNHERIW